MTNLSQFSLINSTNGGLPTEKKFSYNLSMFFDNRTVIGDGTADSPLRVNEFLLITRQEYADSINPVINTINNLNVSSLDINMAKNLANAAKITADNVGILANTANTTANNAATVATSSKVIADTAKNNRR